MTLRTGEIPGWLNGYKAILKAEYAMLEAEDALRVALWVCPNVEDAMRVYDAWLAYIIKSTRSTT